MSDGGKGSAPRPFSVDSEIFSSNFDRIFGKKGKQNVLQAQETIANGQAEVFDATQAGRDQRGDCEAPAKRNSTPQD